MELVGLGSLAWRTRRNGLGPVGGRSAVELAERTVALRGWPAEAAELAIGIRRRRPGPGGLAEALESGELIRSYAFRGGSYVFTPSVGSVLLAVHTATPTWQTDRYQRQGGFAQDDWQPVREAFHEFLTDGPLTRCEIGARLAHIPGLQHLSDAASSGAGADSLYKPLHWWGQICFGPERDGQSTFRLLGGDLREQPAQDVDEAGRAAIVLYLQAYAPATIDNIQYWLGDGLGAPRRRILQWLADLGDDVSAVSIDGVPSFALTRDLDELATSEATDAVRLLPAYDPWVMNPGTSDRRIVPLQHRALASRGSCLAIRGGVVCGTWRRRAGTVTVSWFDDAPPVAALRDEVDRLSMILGRELELAPYPRQSIGARRAYPVTLSKPLA